MKRTKMEEDNIQNIFEFVGDDLIFFAQIKNEERRKRKNEVKSLFSDKREIIVLTKANQLR